MTWAKLDDQFPHHPKSLKVGLEALGFDAAGICYCARHLTDGFIADASILAVYPPIRDPHRLAKRLVRAGRWRRDNRRKGYVIHHYLDYNPSREQVIREREAAKVRANKRRSSGEQTPNNHRSSAAPTRPDPTQRITNTSTLREYLVDEGFDDGDVDAGIKRLENRQQFGDPIRDPVAWLHPILTKLATARQERPERRVVEVDGERMEYRDGQWEIVA